MGNAGYGNHTESKGDPKDGKRPSQPPRNPPADERADRSPPAGPHADPSLVNSDATPGAGTLTPPEQHDDGDATSG